jgi:flagellar basal body P-ring formation protein FlgA
MNLRDNVMKHVRTLGFLLAMLGVCMHAPAARAAWQTPGAPVQELAQSQPIPPVGITTSIRPAYFNITAEDVNKAVAEQLQLQAIVPKADVSMSAGSPATLYSADHPLKLVVHALQVDTQARRWQGQANILANGKTETVRPISGIYTALIDVPVLTKQLGRTDVVEASDIAIKAISERQIRKDTVTDAKQLIGLSPRASISPNRPIRISEVSAPLVIKKGDTVQMTFTNPFMSLRTNGIALQDGARGEMIRVKNEKSERAVSGRVMAGGHIEVNNDATPVAQK